MTRGDTTPGDVAPWSFERTFLSGELADLVDTYAETFDPDARDALLSQYTHPDAREAEEYFEAAEQINAHKIRVEHAGREATIIATRHDRWRIVTDRPTVPGPTAQHLAVPEGVVITRDEGEQLSAECYGLFQDHTEVYSRFGVFLERLSEVGPPNVDPRVAAGVAIDLISEEAPDDWHRSGADETEESEA